MASRWDMMDFGDPDRAIYTPAPEPYVQRTNYSIPSWFLPGQRDVRGTTPADFIQLNPGTQYRLVDFTGDNDNTVLAQGNTEADFARMREIVDSQLAPQGRRADWRLERVGDDGSIEVLGGDFYNKPFIQQALTTALDIGAPILGGVLLPGVGLGLGSALTAGLGAAAGSGVSSALQGRSLEDSLIRAGLSGLTAGALSAATAPAAPAANSSAIPTGALSGAPMSSIPAGALSAPMSAIPAGALSGIGSAAAAALPEIVVTAARESVAPALSGLAGGVIGTGIGSLSPSVSQIADMLGPQAEAQQPTPVDEIVVTSSPTPPPLLSEIPAIGIGSLPTVAFPPLAEPVAPPAQAPAVPDQNEIVVTTSPSATSNASSVGDALAGIGGTVSPTPASNLPEIVVTTTPTNTSLGALPAAGLGLGALAGIGGSAITPFTPPPGLETAAPAPDPNEIVVTANPITDTSLLVNGLPPLTLAGVAAGTAGGGPSLGNIAQGALGGLGILQGLGGLLGLTGNQNAGGAGIGNFNPNPGTVTYQPLARQQIAPTFDPFTYGQTGGEFRFFTDAQPQFQINQPSVGIAPPPQQPVQMARGGIVRGIGGGQDDLIDAKLSDGEYVISAQDVSDLGDGSNEEGARRLDEMRKLIRKQAGRKNIRSIAKPQKDVRSLLKAAR